MKIPKNVTAGTAATAAQAMAGVTKAANANAAQTIKILTDALSNPKFNPGKFGRMSITYAIRQLSNGRTAGRILSAVGKNLGRVITASEARKVLETKLNAKTAQQAIRSNESIQKAAINAGLWNNGINYDNTPSSTNDTDVAPGQTGNSQSGTIGGSFLGG